MKRLPSVLLGVLLGSRSCLSADIPLHKCDELAGHPEDHQSPGDGVWNKVVPDLLKARTALKAYPNELGSNSNWKSI